MLRCGGGSKIQAVKQSILAPSNESGSIPKQRSILPLRDVLSRVSRGVAQLLPTVNCSSFKRLVMKGRARWRTKGIFTSSVSWHPLIPNKVTTVLTPFGNVGQSLVKRQDFLAFPMVLRSVVSNDPIVDSRHGPFERYCEYHHRDTGYL